MFRRAAVANDAEEVEGGPVRRRRGFGRRGQARGEGSAGAGAGAAAAAGAGMLLLARAVRLIATIVALIIAAGIALIVLDANAANSIVSTIHDAARSLVGPFDGMFTMSDRKLAIAVNWGIALVIYLVIGSIVAGLIARLGTAGRARAA
ncbi:MAG TPA: hypothetical protein VGN69_09015 [Solirubrobacteraceae bacterium]|jgi:hypothetical protein|nr:hypothetical protein [Solirubrobacteraceae bacterium]